MIDPGLLRLVSLVAILVLCFWFLLLTWLLCVFSESAYH